MNIVAYIIIGYLITFNVIEQRKIYRYKRDLKRMNKKFKDLQEVDKIVRKGTKKEYYNILQTIQLNILRTKAN